MKSYRQLMAVALGLFMAFSFATGSYAIDCSACKVAIPSSTKPVVEVLKADAKCSACGMEMKANTGATKVACPACKAETVMCGMCSQKFAQEAANAAIADAQKATDAALADAKVAVDAAGEAK